MEPILQIQDHGCGYSAVKALLTYLTGNRDYAYLEEPKADEAPSLRQIIDYAADWGLTLDGYQAVEKDALFPNELTPALVLLEKPYGQHLVLLTRAGRFLRIYDSDEGWVYLTRRAFAKVWTGVYLLPESTRYLVTPPHLKAKEKVHLPWLILTAAMPTLCLIGGLAFLDKAPLGYTFLGAVVLTLILNRGMILLASRSLDEVALRRLGTESNHQAAYTAFQTYKGLFLSLPLKVGSGIGFLASIAYLGASFSWKILWVMGLFLFGSILIEIYRKRHEKKEAAAFGAYEKRYFAKGEPGILEILLARQSRYARSLGVGDLTNYLLMGACFLALWFYCELGFETALLTLFLFFPIREAASLLVGFRGMKRAYRVAKRRFYTRLH